MEKWIIIFSVRIKKKHEAQYRLRILHLLFLPMFAFGLMLASAVDLSEYFFSKGESKNDSWLKEFFKKENFCLY